MDQVHCGSTGAAIAFWGIWIIEMAGAFILLTIASARVRAIHEYRAIRHTYVEAVRTFFIGLWSEMSKVDRVLFGFAAGVYSVSLVALPILALTRSLSTNC